MFDINADHIRLLGARLWFSLLAGTRTHQFLAVGANSPSMDQRYSHGHPTVDARPFCRKCSTVAVRDREFLNRPIGRGGVNELTAGVGGRRAVGDLRRAHEGKVAGVNCHNVAPVSASMAI